MHEAEKAQASQVGILSVCSFIGRFAVGFLADHLSHTHTIPRTSCLMLSTAIGIVATSILLNVTDVNRLWVVSALWGVSYGTVFALFPALVLERFGIEHFAQNAGVTGIAAAPPAFEPAKGVGEGLICLEGRGMLCYEYLCRACQLLGRTCLERDGNLEELEETENCSRPGYTDLIVWRRAHGSHCWGYGYKESIFSVALGFGVDEL
ncbi:hypothetical protein OPQ81_000545 [Rhizoctonia solani]|nr:hypothetical protein OPQ81_000545 [Rhizoctonia solani]